MGSRILVTGATGFIGGELARSLNSAGRTVRCLVRDPQSDSARALQRSGMEVRGGDVTRPRSLAGAGRDVDAAFYLIHGMGRGHRGQFAARERDAARAFAQMAKAEGVQRIIYLGGLGDSSASTHLQSRHETALVLREEGPDLTYMRASMVVGSRSESYRTLRYLVQRLPAMIAPAWLKNETQPIAVDDAVRFLADALDLDQTRRGEIQIGGPDVLTYGEMLDRMAVALGMTPRPRVPVPLITPWLSSLWIGLVTPVDAGIARPLIEGLSTPTTVTDQSGMRLFDIEPRDFDTALQEALSADSDLHPEREAIGVEDGPLGNRGQH